MHPHYRSYYLPTLPLLNIYDLLRRRSCLSAVSSSSDCMNPHGGLYMQAGKKPPWRRSRKSRNTTGKNSTFPLKTCTTRVKSRRPSEERSQPPVTRWSDRSFSAPLHKTKPRIRLHPYRGTLLRIIDTSARTRALVGAHRPTHATHRIVHMETTPVSRIRCSRTSRAGFGGPWSTG